jgi:hypothetical protein
MKVKPDVKNMGGSWVKMARDIIKPDRSYLTDADHEVAKMRQILKMIQEEVAYFHLDINPKNPKHKTLESVHDALGKLLYTRDGRNLNYPDGTNAIDIYDFCNKYGIYDHSIHEEHSGECTGEMHECQVCYIEQFYDLKSEIKGLSVERQRFWKSLYDYDKKQRSEMGAIRRMWHKIW